MARIAIKKNRHDIAFDCLNNVVILSDNDPMKVVNAIEYVEQYQCDKVNELITAEQFKELISDYNAEEEKLKDRLKSIDNEINYYTLKESSNKNTKELFNKYQQLEKLNRVIVDEFVDKIYIGKINEETNTRDIEIKWNFE